MTDTGDQSDPDDGGDDGPSNGPDETGVDDADSVSEDELSGASVGTDLDDVVPVEFDLALREREAVVRDVGRVVVLEDPTELVLLRELFLEHRANGLLGDDVGCGGGRHVELPLRGAS